MTDANIERRTTNVFADLGLPDPSERRTKTRLTLAINRIAKDQGLRIPGTPRIPGTRIPGEFRGHNTN
jgi:hypothetical protein